MRVLIAEDSLTTREYLTHLLEQDSDIRVAGTARNGAEAVELAARLRPDVVLMDVFMPKMDGYEATRRIMEHDPIPIVMISTGFDSAGMATTFDALAAGAVAVVEKPRSGDDPEHAESVRELLTTVRLMAGVRVVRRWAKRPGSQSGATAFSAPSAPAVPAAPALPVPPRGTVRLVAIGASTGGPAALAEILGALPPNFPVPLVIVQHISRGFTGGLSDWLNEQTPLRVRIAVAGERVLPGGVYLAPDDRQLAVQHSGQIQLTACPPEAGHCPSVSYLFRSVAAAYGADGMGILLTGMGQDGAAGLAEIRRAGGTTIAQDQESCVVFGMPGRAIQLGAAEQVLPPRGIAEVLRTLNRGR